LVENGGFGAKAAAPIARSMIDYWLTGENALALPPPQGHQLLNTNVPQKKRLRRVNLD